MENPDQDPLFASSEDGKSIPEYEENTLDFWEIWHSLSGYLLPLCRKWLNGSSIDPEEALSGAMMDAWEGFSRSGDKPIVNMRAWITRIAHNHCMDLHRAGKRWADGSFDSDYGRDQGIMGRSESPEDTFVRNELYATMRSAMDRLPERLRGPMILRSLQGMPYREIARHLNISTENVRKRVQQAREMLQENMQGIGRGANSPHGQDARGPAPGERQLAETVLRRESPELPDDYAYAHPIEFKTRSGKFALRTLYLETRPGRTTQKIKTLRNYIAKFSSGWKKRWELALLYVETGELELALEELTWITDKQPWYFQATVLLARIERWLGNSEAASRLYRNAGSQVRLESTKIHLRGLAEWSDGDYDSAEKSFRAAYAAAPEHLVHLRALGRLYLWRANYPRFHTVCGEIVQKKTGNGSAIADMVQASLSMGLTTEAEKWLSEVCDDQLESWTLLKQMLSWKMRTAGEDTAKASACRSIVKKVLVMEKNLGQAMLTEAQWSYWFRRKVTTLEQLQKIQNRNTLTPEVLIGIAELYFSLGAEAQAVALVPELIRAYPENPRVVLESLRIIALSSLDRKISLNIESIAQRFSWHWEVQSMAGLAMARQGQNFEKIVPYVSAGVEMQPLLPRAWFLYGMAALASGHKREAIRALKKGWNAVLRPQTPVIAAMIALYLGHLEYLRPLWFKEAEEAGYKLLDWDPPMAHFILAQATWGLGKEEESFRWWKMSKRARLAHPYIGLKPGNLFYINK